MQVVLFGGDFASGIFSDFACRNAFRASNLLCNWIFGEDLTKSVYLKKRTQPGHPHLPPPCAMECYGNGAAALWQGAPQPLTPQDSPTEWHLGNSCPQPLAVTRFCPWKSLRAARNPAKKDMALLFPPVQTLPLRQSLWGIWRVFLCLLSLWEFNV